MDLAEITLDCALDLEESFVFNGIDGRSGDYMFPAMTAQEIVDGLKKKDKTLERPLPPGLDPKNLAQTGWGVVFHEQASCAVREALAPLLQRRQEQAGQRYEHYYQELRGPEGYRDGMSKEDFLEELGASGTVNPNRLPYYLLLVGGPERIPFDFQHQLDVQYAVGRIAFDTVEEYARYAQSVVEAETARQPRGHRAAFFGVRNPDDRATILSADRLVRPLAERLSLPEEWQMARDWKVTSVLGEEATKERLGRLLGGEETPALLFTASHGMGFPKGDRLQRAHQGALLCQDWPGPRQWRKAIPPDLYFSGDDVNGTTRLQGLIAFHFACHGVGVPALDEFAMRDGQPPQELAPEPFVSRLPQRLLGNGALAVIGHVERTWAYSFLGRRSQSQLEAFEYALRMLMEGYPVGHAMEWFNYRYGELAADLTRVIQQMNYGEQFNPLELAGLWTANNDARNYAVMGDPAVRIQVD